MHKDYIGITNESHLLASLMTSTMKDYKKTNNKMIENRPNGLYRLSNDNEAGLD